MPFSTHPLTCIEKDNPDDNQTWQERIKIYSDWLLSHNVGHFDTVEWLVKFLKNVYTGRYFIVMSLRLCYRTV